MLGLLHIFLEKDHFSLQQVGGQGLSVHLHSGLCPHGTHKDSGPGGMRVLGEASQLVRVGVRI